MLLDILLLLFLCRCGTDSEPVTRRRKAKNSRMALLLCQLMLLLLSCRAVQSAAVPQGADVERVKARSLLHRIACAFDDCAGRSRSARDVPFAVLDQDGGDVTVRLKAEIVNQMNLLKLWPRHVRKDARLALVGGHHRRLWTMWKRNETVMFGIHVSGTDTYHFLTVHKKNERHTRLCLTEAMTAEDIGDKDDGRYFQIEGSLHEPIQSLMHVGTGLYLGLSKRNPSRVVLTNFTNRTDWDFPTEH